jgi:hypothetical protein
MRDEISTYLETKVGSKLATSQGAAVSTSSSSRRHKDPDAMDVDAFGKAKGKGKGGKGGGKSGGKQQQQPQQQKSPANSSFPYECRNCGRVGHKASECWRAGGGQANAGQRPAQSQGGAQQGKQGGKGHAKGKGKGKSANSLESADAQQDNAQPVASLFNLCALDLANVEWHNGVPYAGSGTKLTHYKFNLDSGAAVTALPRNFAPHIPVTYKLDSEALKYRTASGELVDDEGEKVVIGMTNAGMNIKLSGRVVNVHKPLMSAHKVCEQNNDIWLGIDGGYIYPKDGVIGTELRRTFNNLVQRHGDSELVPVYIENGVFMTDVFVPQPSNGNSSTYNVKIKNLAPVDGSGMDEQAVPSPADFPRRAQAQL